jgi:hypothetical protein
MRDNFHSHGFFALLMDAAAAVMHVYVWKIALMWQSTPPLMSLQHHRPV